MKVYLDTIGCRLNQAEIELYASQFRASGYTLVNDPGEADVVVINSCAVTSEASSDSRGKVRQAARAGAQNIVVTGCYATLSPAETAALPGVTRVVANADKDTLVGDLLGVPTETFDLEPVAREPLPGIHHRTRAFIKVQDGCDNHCTYCITTVARGAGRSRPAADVLRDIQLARLGGAQEIVLTGVHLGSWGHDLSPRLHLRDLIRCVLDESDAPRLRLSSLEPWDLDREFFDLWRDERLCRHLHLPLQSGSANILRRMARKTTPESYAELAAHARVAAPEMAITTDVIVGFPGEGETEFEESLAFVRAIQFAGGHVFHYSPRPGTAAAGFPGKVAPAVSKERSARMREVFAESAAHYREQFIDRTMPVLWEATRAVGPQGWLLSGLTDNYLRVSAWSAKERLNQFSTVHLERMDGDGLEGTLLK